MDFSKVKSIVLPQGNVSKLSINGVDVWKIQEIAKYINQVTSSIEADGSVFGYQDNMRVRSGGALGSWSGAVATGYISVKAGDIVRFTCSQWSNIADNGNTFNFGYISNGTFTSLGSYTTGGAHYGNYSSTWVTYKAVEESSGIWKQVVPPSEQITHMRLSCYGLGADLIVTVNQEIID